jgi:hypothetical protein
MRRGWVATLFVVLGGLTGAGATVVIGFLFAWNCSSGDGGVPFVAHDSPQTDLCGATGDGLLVAGVCLVAVAALAAAAYSEGRAWVQRRRSPWRFVALVIVVATIPVVLFLLASLPSSECNAEDQAAYEEWMAEGARGDPPAECARY